jgi:prepilin-type N-terminal cleavage/methylation domain-containing protein
MTMRRVDLKADHGFTLIELLAYIAIGSIVIAALSAVLITTFKTQDETADRLAASHDTQLVATWLPVDVLSAAIDEPWSVDPDTANPCSGPPPGTDVANVMLLSYTKTSLDSAQVVNYRLEQFDSNKALVRYQCIIGNTPLRIVLANTLKDVAKPAVAMVTCDEDSSGQCTSPISVTLKITHDSGETVTYDSNGRTGVQPPPFSSSSSSSSSSPCVVTNETLTPSTVGRSTSGGNTDKLASNVAVAVTTTGSCSNLTIQYTIVYQSTSTPMTTNLEGGPSSWTATIPGTPQGAKWNTGTYAIAVIGATNSFSADLTVT